MHVPKTNIFNKFDKLNQERIRYMRAAENFAGLSPPNGMYEWSTFLEKAGITVTYWKLWLNLLRSRVRTSIRLERLCLSITMDDLGHHDVEYVTLQLKATSRGLRLVQR